MDLLASFCVNISFEVNAFKRILKVFQQYLTDHYYPGPSSPDESLTSTVKILSLFYHANESASPSRLVEISEFYNDALCRKLNFKEEYKTWKKGFIKPEFSYFSFPFLFDPVAKTRILHIDAMTQMSLEFEDAFVHQALVIHAQRFLHDSASVASFEQGLEKKTNPYLVLEVRRLRLVDDVLDQITKKQADLKKPLKGNIMLTQLNLLVVVKKVWTKAECKRSFSKS